MDNEMKLRKDLELEKDFTPPSFDEWKKVIESELKGAPYEKLITKTYEGINLQPIYTQNDIKGLPHLNEMPGTANYSRGGSTGGYAGKSWDICQELPFGDAEEFNEALKYDLERGQTAINLKLDYASKLGLDADYAKVGEVGKNGVSISGIRSFSRALKGVNLRNYPLYIEAGASPLPILATLAGYLKQENVDIKEIKFSIDADPLSYLAENGKLPVSLESIYDEMAAAVKFCTSNCGDARVIGVNTSAYHNAGASAVQELAFAAASGIEYLDKMISRGIAIDDAARSIRFTFSIGQFYFMEVAKLRAARIIWSNIVKAYGGSEEAGVMKIHGRTSFYNQSVFDPYVNMLRTTTEAFSAVLGGVDSLHTNPFDETFGLPDTFSRRIARNTQIILKEESHLDQVIDPAGGSYFVEKLTAEIAEAAWKLAKEIENHGGMGSAIISGFVQDETAKTASLKKADLAKRKSVAVGTNMYANMTEEKLPLRDTDYNALYKKRSQYLQALRTSASGEKDNAILEKLQSLTENTDSSVVETAASAILDGATMGEITRAFRSKEGEAIEVKPLKSERLTEIYEKLRNASIEYKNRNGNAPKIFLATMGSVTQHKGRADFSRGFFEIAGFEIIYPSGFQTSEEAAKSAAESGAPVAVICSTDETYPEIVPVFTKTVKGLNPDITVVLAGYPKDQVEAHKASGVDEFIFLGADAVDLLTRIMIKIGAMK